VDAPGSPDWLPSFRAIAEDESAAGRFAGAVLVCRRQERVFAEAYGLADREQGIPNQLSTRFRNGSLNKISVPSAMSAGRLV
jgi:CubicO group peptidase (beta-lactamase class C family)